MLTSKSNFNTLRELKGKKITEEALKQLYDNCTSKDFINLNGNISKGYPAEIANFIMQKIDVTNADKIKILVINDLSFHMYNCLTNVGILPKNITLAFGKWNKDGTPLNDKKVYNIMSMFAKSNFVEFERGARNIVTLEEIMSMNNNIKFDYIISNPPYALGNTITKSIIDNINFDNFINLMPLSCYKSKELYKTVKSLEVVDPKAFEDAAITDNLCICTLKPKNQPLDEKSYEDLAMLTYDPEYREFYKLNVSAKYVHGKFITLESKEQLDKTFFISPRVCLDGVHKKGFDVDANAGNISINDLNEDAVKKAKTKTVPLSSFEFISAKAKNNFKLFWYYNPLMDSLIRGLNKNGGSCAAAIPNIDYSIDRDYEHLTLDDIMKILREENPDVA
jgi:hypothetical protein